MPDHVATNAACAIDRAHSAPSQSTPIRVMLTRLAQVASLLLVLVALAGCRVPGRARTMELVGEGRDPVRLRGDYREAYFTDGPSHTTIYLSELPLAELLGGGKLTGQVLHIELLWIPKAGRTPIESTAINATIRHIVLVDGEVAVFAGAGFVWPHSDGQTRRRMSVRDATIAMTESTDAIVDLLTPANLRGTFVARRDADQVMRFRRAISQIVSDAFQESRIVDARNADGSAATQVDVTLLGARSSDASRVSR